MNDKSNMFVFCIILTVSSLCGCKIKKTVVDGINHPMQQRLIFVGDMDHPVKFAGTLSEVQDFVDKYANTQVTTFMVSAGEEVPTYRSKYNRIAGDNDDGRLNCGTNTALYNHFRTENRNILNLEKEYGTDVATIQLKRAREKGMEAFLTFRMNDLHFVNPAHEYTMLWTDFWLKHPEFRLNEDVGWHSAGAYDFAHPEVRQYKLNIIFEHLELYGHLIDGYDLDFQRMPVFFKTGEAAQNGHLMTDFVKSVRSKLDELSAKHGRKIMLSARVPHDVVFCYSEGLEVKEWIKLGLIDFITIATFLLEDPYLPVAKSIQDLGNPNIPVYVNVNVDGYSPALVHSFGTKRGIASNIYAQGGNGIYLFNYFFDTRMFKNCIDNVCRSISRDLLMEIGSMETLRKRNKIFALDDGSASNYYRYRSRSTLPLSVSSDMQNVNFHVGDPLQDDVPEQIILFIRTDREVEAEVQVNSVGVEPLEAKYILLYQANINLKPEEKVLVFSVPVSAVQQGVNQIGIRSHEGQFRVLRLEMAVRYGDVATHGYF